MSNRVETKVTMPSSEQGHSEVTDLHGWVAALIGAVSSLSERVEKAEKSRLRKYSLWGGAIALGLSLLLSGGQVWEKFYKQPIEEKQKRREELRVVLGQLTSTYDDYMYKIPAIQDSRLKDMAQRVVSTRQSILRFAAGDLAHQLGDAISAPEAMMVAFEQSQLGQLESAKELYALAVKAAGSGLLAGEAHRMLAGLLFRPEPGGNIQRARAEYDEAVREYKRVGGPNADFVAAAALGEWGVMELWFGDRDVGLAKLEEGKRGLARIIHEYRRW